MSENEEALSTKDIAKLFGVTEETIRKYNRSGKLTARYKVGKKKYHIHDVQEFRRGMFVPNRKNRKKKGFPKIT